MSQKRRAQGLALALAVALTWSTGCSQETQEADLPALRTAFETENARFMEAFAKRDPAALAAFYADSGQVFPPNAAPVAGRAAIQELWRGFLETPVSRLQLTTLDVDGTTSSAWETGRYTLIGANGSTVDEGKYIVIWRRDDAGWKIFRDMFSSNMPAAGAAKDTTRVSAHP